MPKKTIVSLKQAAEYFLETYAEHPDRQYQPSREAAYSGKPWKYPVFAMMHLAVPGDQARGEEAPVFPEVRMAGNGVEARLARELMARLEPLKLLNPVNIALSPGGVNSYALVPCFGIPLDKDAQNTPAFTLSIDKFLAMSSPDPERAGPLPDMRERIALIIQELPSAFKIQLPDMQGPFNLAHALFGNEVFTAPLDDDEKFRKAMKKITDFWIELYLNFRKWIGKERFSWDLKAGLPHICECSVNMVSEEFYKNHVLEHDLRIAGIFNQVSIHPCSGPHVFRATLENLPVKVSEAGFISKTASGCTSIDAALAIAKQAGKSPFLKIGSELPEKHEYEWIKDDIDRSVNDRSLIIEGYTGMHWRRKDRPFIRDLHRRLDDYWAVKFAG